MWNMLVNNTHETAKNQLYRNTTQDNHVRDSKSVLECIRSDLSMSCLKLNHTGIFYEHM